MKYEKTPKSGLCGQATSIATPDTSDNQRLEHAYRGDPDLLNREFVAPCQVSTDTARINFELVTPELFNYIVSALGTVVNPAMIQKDTHETWAAAVKVLASGPECGRVLELNQSRRIGEEDLVITLKGIGSTRFARTEGGCNPWMLRKSFSEESRVELAEFPFHKHYGSLDRSAAETEFDVAEQLRSRGHSCEKVLAIFDIEALVGPDGEYHAVADLQIEGKMPPGTPCIMVRAANSNLRLMDICLPHEKCKTDAVPGLVEHALESYQRLTEHKSATINDYFHYLTAKVVKQELGLACDGYQLSTGPWPDLARNINILGEDLDLEGLEVNERTLASRRKYVDHFESEFIKVENTLRAYANAINHTLGPVIDYAAYARSFEKAVVGAIDSYNFDPVVKGFKTIAGSSSELKAELKYTAFAYFSKFYLTGDVDEIKTYREYLESVGPKYELVR